MLDHFQRTIILFLVLCGVWFGYLAWAQGIEERQGPLDGDTAGRVVAARVIQMTRVSLNEHGGEGLRQMIQNRWPSRAWVVTVSTVNQTLGVIEMTPQEAMRWQPGDGIGKQKGE